MVKYYLGVQKFFHYRVFRWL